MVAFSGFYESHKAPPSGDARGIVPPHRDGHRNGQQSGCILHLRFVCCCPGGRRGNKEQVAAQWRRPVASGKALFMLHWAMQHVLHQHLRMTSPVGIKKTEGMMDGCAGGGELVLRITGVQKTKKEKAKILPVDAADS